MTPQIPRRLLVVTLGASGVVSFGCVALGARLLKWTGFDVLKGVGGAVLVALLVTCAVAFLFTQALRPDADRTVARLRVLRLPGRLARTALGIELAILAGLVSFSAPGERVRWVAFSLCASAVMLLLPAVLYADARRELLPLAIARGDATLPEGRRRSIALTLALSIGAIAVASLIPALILGAVELRASSARGAAEYATRTAEELVRSSQGLDVAAARLFLARVPLGGGTHALLRAASGVLLPEELATTLRGRPFVEVAAADALRGWWLRVVYDPLPLVRVPLLLTLLGLLSCALGSAWVMGRRLSRDLRATIVRVERVIRNEDPGPAHPVAISEIRRVTAAANRLLERVPRFTVESFLAIERAEEAQRLKSQFLANMSHDLRSPLNSILGFSELLLRGIEGPISANQRVELDRLQLRGQQLLRLLTEILDMAKLESGKMELRRQSVLPAELVRAAVQEAQRGRVGPNETERLTVTLQPGQRPMDLDALRITQMMTHLLNYALDFDGPVILRARQQGAPSRSLAIEVEAEEIKVPNDVEDLFVPFRPTDDGADLHLSLPLARRLAVLHGGSLVLSQRRPARFTVVIPGRAI